QPSSIFFILFFASISACESKITHRTSPLDKAGIETGKEAYKLTAPDCLDPDLSQVPSHVTMMLCDGTIASGQLTINYCKEDRQEGCLTTAQVPAIRGSELNKIAPENLKSGVEISGVIGT